MDVQGHHQRDPPHTPQTLGTSPVLSAGPMAPETTKLRIPGPHTGPFLASSNEESSSIVVPEEVAKESWISLSSLDKFILPIYIPVYCIYRPIPAEDFNSFVDKLRISLSKVLVPYYPWSGRLKKNPSTQSWDLHCDNGGVEFKVVHVNEELRNTVFCSPCLELRLLAPRLDAVPKEDAPPVAALGVQVTRFSCGSVALGCSFHHQCGDAHAVSMFLQAWSQLMRGETLSVLPIHDRSSIIPPPATKPSAPPPVAIVGTKESAASTGRAAAAAPPPVAGSGKFTVAEDFADCSLEGFVYDKEALRELKDMAPGSTSFEATTAFVVRHVMKLTPNEDMTKFVLMVDFRARLSASTFAGNLALPKAVVVPRAGFIDGPLANSVAPIHEAVKGADDAYFRAFAAYAGRGPPSKERALAVSSCSRLGLYDVDFGYGGPCFAGVNPPVPRLVPEFLIFLPNVNKDDGFIIYLQLNKALMNKLLQDPDFVSIGSKFDPLSVEIPEEEIRVTPSQHSRI